MHNFEIEIKSLLGSKANADALVEKMQTADNDFKILGAHKQLNHYFVGGSLKSLFDKVNHLLTEESKHKLEDLSERAKDFSVRTREADGKIILVVKATVDDTTSENGTARLEWEAKLNNLNLEELDKLILNAGFTYQAKWSRERQEFLFHSGKRELSVSIDKNAGYGFLAELEVVVNDACNVPMNAPTLTRSFKSSCDSTFDTFTSHKLQNWYGRSAISQHGFVPQSLSLLK
jgi:adenylate cyclase class IV